VTFNGLVIAAQSTAMASDYLDGAIHDPHAFVEVANGSADFESATRQRALGPSYRTAQFPAQCKRMIRLCLLLLLLPGLAQAACRQALSLALDVSSSVDDSEYQLQIEGVIAALNAPTVQQILFLQPEAPITLHVFEWSGPVNHTIIVPWTPITGPADLARITAQLRAHERATKAPNTAIGSAMLAGFAYLEQQPDCWMRTLDVSGDGETNTGPLPEEIGDDLRPEGVIVNGLVVGSGNFFGDRVSRQSLEDLRDYYLENVIRGPGSFVEVALDYDDYAATMERKLLRELAAQILGQTSDTGGSNG
jgi:hypothetical protein